MSEMARKNRKRISFQNDSSNFFFGLIDFFFYLFIFLNGSWQRKLSPGIEKIIIKQK